MRTTWKIFAAAVIASSAPLLAQPAGAAPLSQSLALSNANIAQVETVQWRRGGFRRGGRWIGPAAGFAAGVAIGSALAPRYYDYGYAEPGYAYVPVEPYGYYRGWAGSGRPGCTRENRDENPMCQ